MQPVKKVEIVADSLELPNILKVLDKLGVSGYTVIKNVTGKGERGERTGDELTDVFKNSYVMVACPDEQMPALVEAIRPILKRFGGVCLITNAQWVIH
jgi:nitrogen regulatory protein PII